MFKQTKLQCLGGMLSGQYVDDQGEYFFNSELPLRGNIDETTPFELPKEMKYRKVKIPHPNVLGDYYYVCEITSDQKAKKMVLDIQDAC